MTMSVMPFLVVTTCTSSVTSWNASRSPVTSSTRIPASLAPLGKRAEDVVALPPLELDDRDVERAEQLLDHRELGLELRTVGGRCTLYCASASMRNAGLPRSNATTTPSGRRSATILSSIEMKPKAALVGRPSGAVIVGGSAWNARWMRLLPSIDGDRALGMAPFEALRGQRLTAQCTRAHDTSARALPRPSRSRGSRRCAPSRGGGSSAPTFERMRRTCTSTVREPP